MNLHMFLNMLFAFISLISIMLTSLTFQSPKNGDKRLITRDKKLITF